MADQNHGSEKPFDPRAGVRYGDWRDLPKQRPRLGIAFTMDDWTDALSLMNGHYWADGHDAWESGCDVAAILHRLRELLGSDVINDMVRISRLRYA